MQRRWWAANLAAMGMGLACGGPNVEQVGSSAQAVSGTLDDRSIVVRDPEVLALFPFSRTMSQIRGSMLLPGEAYASGENRLAIYQRWMRSFDVGADGCDRAGVDPNDYGLVCPRLPEAQLATIDPFANGATIHFEPVGLFNRFDLTPADGRTCGEHRIVYAMNAEAGAPFNGRAFIIFEAALPNPTPSSGVNGCLPVAQFWQALTDDPDVNSRAAKLEAFYYGGTAIPGFPPVVAALNYGLNDGTGAALRGRPGQIRTNFFVDFREWHLREFKLRKSCPTPTTCRQLFAHQTVKVNPAEELFAGTHTNADAYQAEFITQVASLAATNLNLIAMTTGNNFNEFESVSQATNVVYRDVAEASLRTAIRAELTRINSGLSVNNILDRATTQTCAGCHQVSVGARLGGQLTWPGTQGFVHIDEAGGLSPALREVFIPHRITVLEDFINDRETLLSRLGAEATLSGRPIDSAN